MKTNERIENIKLIKHPTDQLTYKIIGMAMEVHSRLGPGLKEEMYQKAMEEMLERARMNYEPQRQVEVYLGNRLIGLLFIDIPGNRFRKKQHHVTLGNIR